MQARFLGDPRNGGDGPEEITVLGLSFVKGVWREVGSEARFASHDHFETRPDPLDHDQDGRKGGSKPRRSRKQA